MPVGAAVRQGAEYRARAALERGADFGVGAEGGVEFQGEDGYLFNWCAIAAPDGRLFAAPSAKVLLPPAWSAAVRAGAELGPLVQVHTGQRDVNAHGGAIGVLTRGHLERSAFFEQALYCALAPFLVPELYCADKPQQVMHRRRPTE